MMRKAARRSAGNRESLVANEGLQSGGQAIDASVRMHLEPTFGHNFSHVRIFADAEAANAAASLDAAAYTVGSDIAFGADNYRPDTPAGLALLAHELTHVGQNDRFGDGAGGAGVSVEADGAEHEAMAAAGASMAGLPVPQPAVPAPDVSRSDDDDPLWNTITDNTLSGSLGYMTEASKDASSWFNTAAGETSGLPWLGRALGPLGVISNVMGMGKALDGEGLQGAADFTASGMGVVGSLAPTMELMSAGAGALGLGTTATTAGVAGTGVAGGLGAAATALGPVAALSGSFAGGYALGGKAVGASDEIAEEQGYFHDDNHKAQSGTSEAADWGVSVNDYIDSTWMGDTAGDVLGGVSAGLGGIGTTAYTLGRRGVEKVGDAAGSVADFASDNWTLDRDEIDWGRTFNPFRW